MASSTGQCLCGGVKFVAENVKTHHSACHCGMCRRWTGAPLFTTPAESVTFEGEDSIVRYDSSKWAQRGFCKTCGSHLFYFLKPVQKYMMSVGAFDDASPFHLSSEIFIDRKPDGYAFTGQHPRLTEAETLAAFAPKPVP